MTLDNSEQQLQALGKNRVNKPNVENDSEKNSNRFFNVILLYGSLYSDGYLTQIVFVFLIQSEISCRVFTD